MSDFGCRVWPAHLGLARRFGDTGFPAAFGIRGRRIACPTRIRIGSIGNKRGSGFIAAYFFSGAFRVRGFQNVLRPGCL